jgi:hypothetical protein
MSIPLISLLRIKVDSSYTLPAINVSNKRKKAGSNNSTHQS